MRARRFVLAAVTALVLAPVLAACSLEAGVVEPVGGDLGVVESSAAVTDAELQTVTAEHLTAQVPADWQSMGDVDGWSYVYQLSNSAGGVAGRIGFMPGGAAMTAQEAVDWFISQIEGTDVTDGDYAPVTTLREGEDRANTPEFVAQVDESLDITGNWKGTTS